MADRVMGWVGWQVGAAGWMGYTRPPLGPVPHIPYLALPALVLLCCGGSEGRGSPPPAALTLVSQRAVIRPFSTVTSVEKVLWE